MTCSKSPLCLTPQLLRKLIHCGDTSCLIPLLAVAEQKDRALLQAHCHSAGKRILEGSPDEGALREAVAYLSIAIMASGEDRCDISVKHKSSFL